MTNSPPEIVCDESGYEGDRLIGGETAMFAHGSIRMSVEEADTLITELRRRIGSPATEYKANHLQRSKHLPVLRWLLGPHAPLLGAAHVVLIDKAQFLIRTVCRTLIADGSAAGPGRAEQLYRCGPRLFGPGWTDLLMAANTLLRTNGRLDSESAIATFFRLLDSADEASLSASTGADNSADDSAHNSAHNDAHNSAIDNQLDRLGETLEQLRAALPRAQALRASMSDDPEMLPMLDPLLPGIVGTVRHWSTLGSAVALIHDRQNALSPHRIEQIMQLLRDGDTGTAPWPT